MNKMFLSLFLVLLSCASSYAQQLDAFIGEIKLFAGSYPPSGWALCDGQVLQIRGNEALYSIIGNRFGGDGVTNFALPDLRSRVAVHSGNSMPIALKRVELGEKGGSEKLSILPQQVTLKTNGVKFDTQTTGRDGAPFAVQSVVTNTNNQPQELDNRQPYLGISYIICLYGIYPMRD